MNIFKCLYNIEGSYECKCPLNYELFKKMCLYRAPEPTTVATETTVMITISPTDEPDWTVQTSSINPLTTTHLETSSSVTEEEYSQDGIAMYIWVLILVGVAIVIIVIVVAAIIFCKKDSDKVKSTRGRSHK